MAIIDRSSAPSWIYGVDQIEIEEKIEDGKAPDFNINLLVNWSFLVQSQNLEPRSPLSQIWWQQIRHHQRMRRGGLLIAIYLLHVTLVSTFGHSLSGEGRTLMGFFSLLAIIRARGIWFHSGFVICFFCWAFFRRTLLFIFAVNGHVRWILLLDLVGWFNV